MRQNHQRRATGRSRTGAPRAAFVTAVAIAAVAATTALVLFGAGTAGAHTDLVSSDPAADAHLEHAPSAITLTFAGAPMELGATILVMLALITRRNHALCRMQEGPKSCPNASS